MSFHQSSAKRGMNVFADASHSIFAVLDGWCLWRWLLFTIGKSVRHYPVSFKLGNFTVWNSIKLSTNFAINYVTNSRQQADFNFHLSKLHLSECCVHLRERPEAVRIGFDLPHFTLRTYNLIWWGPHVHLCICISSDLLTLDGIDLKIKILFDRMFGCGWYDFRAPLQAIKRICSITSTASIEFHANSLRKRCNRNS